MLKKIQKEIFSHKLRRSSKLASNMGAGFRRRLFRTLSEDQQGATPTKESSNENQDTGGAKTLKEPLSKFLFDYQTEVNEQPIFEVPIGHIEVLKEPLDYYAAIEVKSIKN